MSALGRIECCILSSSSLVNIETIPLKNQKKVGIWKCYTTPIQNGAAVSNKIMFVHAFSSCNTTLALFNNGKTKFISTFGKNERKYEESYQLSKEKKHTSRGERFLLAV